MLNDKIIVLDPGHSGNPDPGAVGRFSKESDVAWKIACKVQEILAFNWGANVILTKASAADPNSDSLSSRYKKANAVGADLFISIHLNASDNPEANGIETYSAPGSKMGAKLAGTIQNQLVACLNLRDRGVKTANYAVLIYTDCPAVLTEVCFISNPGEEEFINKNLSTAAAAIAQGIVDYFYV